MFGIKFSDIFPRLVDQLGTKNQVEVADFLDITPGAITNFKKRNSFPADTLIKFAVKKNISVDWLLGRQKNLQLSDESSEKIGDKDDYVDLKFIPEQGSPGESEMQYLRVSALKNWLAPQLKGLPENAFMAIVKGDSMTNTLSDGDMVFCDGDSGHIGEVEIEDGIYIVVIEGGEPLVRRVQKLPGRMIKIIADNARYESFSISIKSDCQILGKIIWILKKP